MNEFRSIKLEEFLKQFDLEKTISFMRAIFKFSYTKTHGDKVWDMNSKWLMLDIVHSFSLTIQKIKLSKFYIILAQRKVTDENIFQRSTFNWEIYFG